MGLILNTACKGRLGMNKASFLRVKAQKVTVAFPNTYRHGKISHAYCVVTEIGKIFSSQSLQQFSYGCIHIFPGECFFNNKLTIFTIVVF